jgi:hypothetical protein
MLGDGMRKYWRKLERDLKNNGKSNFELKVKFKSNEFSHQKHTKYWTTNS